MRKRFRDDLFVVWTNGTAKSPSFLDYLNNIDGTGKIKFTMQIADSINLFCLNLTLAQKLLLAIGPSFIPSLADINWYELGKYFTSFSNQLR